MMKRKMMAVAAMCTVMVLASGCGEKKQEIKAPVQTQAAVKDLKAGDKVLVTYEGDRGRHPIM